jgi:hypothetical protein
VGRACSCRLRSLAHRPPASKPPPFLSQSLLKVSIERPGSLLKITKYFHKISVYFPESRLINGLQANGRKTSMMARFDRCCLLAPGCSSFFLSSVLFVLRPTWRPLFVGRVRAPFHPAMGHHSEVSIFCKAFSAKSFSESLRRRLSRRLWLTSPAVPQSGASRPASKPLTQGLRYCALDAECAFAAARRGRPTGQCGKRKKIRPVSSTNGRRSVLRARKGMMAGWLMARARSFSRQLL